MERELKVMTPEEAEKSGIRVTEYRMENVPQQDFEGVVDALIWFKRKMAITACISVEGGETAFLFGYRGNGYSGLKKVSAGDRVNVSVSYGPNGGLRWRATKAEDSFSPSTTATSELAGNSCKVSSVCHM